MGKLKRKLGYKSQAILLGLLVLAALIFINVLARNLSARIDITQDQEYTLSASTKKILAGLEDVVTLKLFFSDNAPSRVAPILDQVRDLVEEFRIHSKGKLQVKLIDPDASPENEQEVQMLGIPPLQLNVVERDKAEVRKIYLGLGLFYADKKEILPVVSEPTHLEYDLTSSLLKLTRPKTFKLGWLNTSAQAEDYSYVENVLSRQIAIDKISGQDRDWLKKNIDALIVVDPFNLEASVVKQIDAVFQSGIPVVILASGVNVNAQLMGVPQSTGLEDWLAKQGLNFNPSLVIDPKYVGHAAFSSGVVQYQMPYPFFVNVPAAALDSKHAITNKLENIIFPWTSSFTIDADSKPDWHYEILAESSNVSFLQEGPPVVSPQWLEQLTEIPNGQARPLAVVASSGNKKLLAIATSALVKNAFVSDFEGNLLFIQNIIDWATIGDDLIGIRSRGKTLRPLPLLDSQSMQIIRWTLLLLTPLFFIGLGLYIRRRHTKNLARLAASLK